MSEKLFSPANREKVLRAVVGKPSGVIAEVGGLSFNLVALSAGEVLSVLGLLTKFADLATQSATVQMIRVLSSRTQRLYMP